MYNLKDAYLETTPYPRSELWEGKMACVLTDKERTFATNRMRDTLEGNTFTLVTQGELTLTCNGKEITLQPNDISSISPDFPCASSMPRTITRASASS